MSTGSPEDPTKTKKNKKKEEKKKSQMLLSRWVCGNVNTSLCYIHNIDPDVEINVFLSCVQLQTQANSLSFFFPN